MNNEWSEVAANGVIHAAQQAFYSFKLAAYEHQRPCVLFKPTLSADGTMWMALLGPDLAIGVAGFGETPAKAMYAFDVAFLTQLTPDAACLVLPTETNDG